jgi:hypothetical protein
VTIIAPQPVVPAGMTILAALTSGLVPAQIQVSGFGTGAVNPTLASLISDGLVNPSALYSTLSIANPAVYGGN